MEQIGSPFDPSKIAALTSWAPRPPVSLVVLANNCCPTSTFKANKKNYFFNLFFVISNFDNSKRFNCLNKISESFLHFVDVELEFFCKG
jgi:hypothetical protein